MSPTRLGLTVVVAVIATIASLSLPAAAQIPHPKKAPAARAYPSGPGRWRAPRAATIRPLRAALNTVTETEPNDALSVADSVALGDTASGTIDPAGDVDFYGFQFTAGTALILEVDANQIGSPLDPTLALFDSVGTELAFNDDYNGLDSRITYSITTTGRYYAAITDYGSAGGPGYFYQLGFGAALPGPGDPTTLFASGLASPWGIAAGPAGELYVADVYAHNVRRVSPSGVVSILASFSYFPWDVVVEGSGNLLVVGLDTVGPRGVVTRVSPQGVASPFASWQGGGAAITIGPDGDVWVIDPETAQLRRYDPTGTPKDSIPITGIQYYDVDLAFSPAGELHFTNAQDAVYKLVGRTQQRVITTAQYIEGIAFDRDGYLYVSNGYLGTVLLYSPTYQLVNDPFARSNLGGPTYLAFGRNASGAMTSRLFADNFGYNLSPPYAGGIVEMNPTGMRAAGFRVGVDLLQISNTTLRSGVMGASYADTVRVVSPPGTPVWSISTGAPPPGLSLDAASGILSGTPEASGSFVFTVNVSAGGRVGLRSFTLVVTRPVVTVAAASVHLLGGDALAPELQRFLDLQGNNNGRYDLGDFRAFLRASGQLPGAAARKERP